MFWDGERWVPEKGPVIRSKRPASRNRLRRWLATLPILLLVPALLIPVVPTEAATYHPRVAAGVAEPGGLVTLTGSGTRPGGYLQARLDRASTRLGLIRVDRRGRFSVQLRLPSTTTPGTHLVTIGRVSYGRLATASIRSTRLLAQTTILSVKVNIKRKGGKSTSVSPPVPAPTPTQAPAPTPTPVSALTPTPVSAPAPTGTAIPSSIDATGSTDASAALISFVGTVPDGSTIVFKAGGVYRMDAALKFAHRHNLTFEGNGATLRANGGTTEASSLFWLGSYGGGNSGIVIRNFTLVGNSPTPGVYQGGREGAHGILVDGGSGIEITNVTVSGVWGDCLYVGAWADGVSFHDSTCGSNGRNGVTVTSAKNLTVQRVAFPKSGYCTFDIEPNVSTEGASGVRFLDNTAGTWTNSFLSAEGAAESVVSGVTVSGNTVTGGSLLTIIGLSRRQNVVFTNNRSTIAAWGPVLRFAHIDGLTVTGNVQPLTSGVLASITDCTGVTTQ